MSEPAHIDALMPAEMAEKAEAVGVRKASMGTLQTLALGVLAGAFIAMGAVFSLTVMADAQLSFGWQRLLGGLVFSVGLIMVVIGGAELFTGNTLIVMAVANRKLGIARLLRNWGLVYVGNLAGAAATAVLVYLAGHWAMGGNAVGEFAVRVANAKCEAGFTELFVRGILGNAMVCIAVWLAFSARSTTDRMLVVVPPIAMFVAAGFEHCVANMFYLPYAMLIRDAAHVGSAAALGMAGIAKNLAAVTAGNIIGGGVMVGLVYWFIYLRGRKHT